MASARYPASPRVNVNRTCRCSAGNGASSCSICCATSHLPACDFGRAFFAAGKLVEEIGDAILQPRECRAAVLVAAELLLDVGNGLAELPVFRVVRRVTEQP